MGIILFLIKWRDRMQCYICHKELNTDNVNHFYKYDL